MKLYLAAAFERQAEMHGYAMRLMSAGHEVTSRWNNPHLRHRGLANQDDATNGDIIRWATDDISDLREADAVASFTGQGGRGGRHVEFGLAIALEKRLLVIGPLEHVFHYLPFVTQYDSVDEFMESMSA
jgi:hypothetical protein